jgi:uncharacterized OB-fold protein
MLSVNRDGGDVDLGLALTTYCEHCGAPTSEGFSFCPKCGRRREVAISSQPGLPLSLARAINVLKGKSAWSPLTIAVLGIPVILVGTSLLWVHYRDLAPGNPSEADARKVFENLRQESNSGVAEIVSFKQVSSETQEILGVKLYSVDYEAELRFPKRVQTERVTGRVTFKLSPKGWFGEDFKFH